MVDPFGRSAGAEAGILVQFAQHAAGQQAGLSGIPLWTTDIGGYAGGDPDEPGFQQLIVRWFQFGAFCPLFRLHGHRAGGPPADTCGPTNGDNEVWVIYDLGQPRSLEQVDVRMLESQAVQPPYSEKMPKLGLYKSSSCVNLLPNLNHLNRRIATHGPLNLSL